MPGKLLRLRGRHVASLPRLVYQRVRVLLYRVLSDARAFPDRARRNQPVLTTGQGEIVLGSCNLGICPSPFYYSGYAHIEARCPGARVVIGDGVHINNNAVIIADRTSVTIQDNTLIGPEFTVFDSDFHHLDPALRQSGTYQCLPVVIEENVFIGSRVTVLKGVTIGRNSVVAAGSVLGTSVPENSIVGGVPAKIIGRV